MCANIKAKEETAYSVVVPFYNEGPAVEELLREIESVMRDLNESYEILAINDGSSDETAKKLDELSSVSPSIIPVNLPFRHGQTACLALGFLGSKGRIIISMDGDLQDDPKNIPAMLSAFKRSNADVLCGWRIGRKDPLWIRLLSRTGNFLQSLFLRTPVHDISCTFRIYKSGAIKKINLAEEGIHRFLPFLLKRANFSLSEKQIRNRPRKYGQSKYSSKKAFKTICSFFKLLSGKY